MNNDILTLNHRKLPKFSVRGNIKKYLDKYYYIKNENNELYEKKILIGDFKSMRYNLTDILKKNDCNILTELSFTTKKSSNDYIIAFSIICGDVKLINYTNKSKFIHNLNILEYFETKFIDIKNFNNDIYLCIDFCIFNNYSNLPLNYLIYCKAINISERYINKKKIEEYSIIENVKFYNLINNNETYKDKVLSNETCFYSLINEKTVKFYIKNKNIISPMIYFCFLWSDNYLVGHPEIESINVMINNEYVINYNSSKIMIDNENNLHYINFYPDNNNDFIKSDGIIGLDYNYIKDIIIHFTFKDSYAVKSRICVGFILQKIIRYTPFFHQ